MTGLGAERFGDQAARMLGAGEHRSERTHFGIPAPWLRGGDEKRRPQRTFGVPKPLAWGGRATQTRRVRPGMLPYPDDFLQGAEARFDGLLIRRLGVDADQGLGSAGA